MKIIRNFSFLTAAYIIEKAITFALVVTLARYLSVEEYGVYALALSFGGLFGHLFDGGVNILLLREMAKKQTNRPLLLGQVIVSKIFIGTLVCLIAVFAVRAMGYSDDVLHCIIIYLIATGLLSFSMSFRNTFIAMERAEFESFVLVLARLFLLGVVVAFVFLNIRIPGIMSAYLVSYISILVFAYLLCKKYFFSPVWGFDFSKILKIIKESFPFAIGAIMGEIFFNIDNIMISKMVGIDSVGYYNAAYKLSYSGILIAHTITLAASPEFAKNWAEKKDHVVKVFKKLFIFLLSVSIPLALVSNFWSEEIIKLVFGGKYTESVKLFKILVWSLPPLYLMHLTIRILEAIGKQRIVAVTMLGCVILNVILNYFLILKFQAVGASVATVITSVIVVLVHMKYLKRFVLAADKRSQP